MTVKLSELNRGDVFLTKDSKLYVFDYKETDGTIMCRRFTDKYYSVLLRANLSVYKMDSLKQYLVENIF